MNTETTLLDSIEFAENAEPRCPCILILDVSGSMAGEPIHALNQGIEQFKNELMQDSLAVKRVELAVVAFNDVVKVVQDFVTPDAFVPATLKAGGATSMGAGILKAFDLVDARKAMYRTNGIAQYCPWCWLLTDGAATDDTSAAEQRIRDAETKRRAAFFAVGVENADMLRLASISVRQPLKLKGLNFASMFEWLRVSLQSVSTSRPGDQVQLPAVGWAKV